MHQISLFVHTNNLNLILCHTMSCSHTHVLVLLYTIRHNNGQEITVSLANWHTPLYCQMDEHGHKCVCAFYMSIQSIAVQASKLVTMVYDFCSQFFRVERSVDKMVHHLQLCKNNAPYLVSTEMIID